VHTLKKLELPIISVDGGGKSDFTCERLLRANCVYFWTFCLTWVYLINAALESEAANAHPPPLHPICGTVIASLSFLGFTPCHPFETFKVDVKDSKPFFLRYFQVF
jgi:hypothetical protein